MSTLRTTTVCGRVLQLRFDCLYESASYTSRARRLRSTLSADEDFLASTEAHRLAYFHFDIGGRARNAGRFIGKVRNELLRALSEKKNESGICQQALARKLDVERALINRQ